MIKLIEGKLYLLNMKFGKINAFYAGKCDACFDRKCDCCDRKIANAHYFYVPTSGETTYKDCQNGQFAETLLIGSTCINKIVEQVESENPIA